MVLLLAMAEIEAENIDAELTSAQTLLDQAVEEGDDALAAKAECAVESATALM